MTLFEMAGQLSFALVVSLERTVGLYNNATHSIQIVLR